MLLGVKAGLDSDLPGYSNASSPAALQTLCHPDDTAVRRSAIDWCRWFDFTPGHHEISEANQAVGGPQTFDGNLVRELRAKLRRRLNVTHTIGCREGTDQRTPTAGRQSQGGAELPQRLIRAI
jgi:hypothetical protein